MSKLGKRLRAISTYSSIRLKERQEKMEAHVEAVRRDSAKIQWLWVNLCQKYGWLDGEDLA